MNEHLLKGNEEIYRKLNIPIWHAANVTGKRVKVAILGYGGTLEHKKPYLTNVNEPANGTGSYHDGDELIHAAAPNAQIYSINVMKKGWSWKEALQWILENSIDIVCCSLRKSTWDDELRELSRKAWEKGVVMIDSSDNEGKEIDAYPALDPHWFVVGAYNGTNGKEGYSSYGSKLDCLMYTGLAVEAKEGYYIPITHTSGATQLVAGMAALLKEYANVTPDGFREFMKENSVDLGEEGRDNRTGYGLFILPEKLPEKEEEEVKPMPEKRYTVCIDPGHGGDDRANRGPTGYVEADGVLDIALKLKAFLEKYSEIKVVMTRTKDETVSLERRVAIANEAGADIFVSIHTNASDSSAAEGIETYHSIFSEIGKGGHKLATCIQEEICQATNRKSRGVKTRKGSDGRDYYYVIKKTKMPAVITECGFHTNPTEEHLLKGDSFRLLCAQGIGRGILRCLDIPEETVPVEPEEPDPEPDQDVIADIKRHVLIALTELKIVENLFGEVR